MTQVQRILASAGYPTDTLIVDFETYFDKEYSLAKIMTDCYIADKRFQVLGLAIKLGGYPAAFIQSNRIHEFLSHVQLEEKTVVMHNAKFDALLLAEKYGIYPPYIIDTKDLACAWDAEGDHHLKDLAEQWNLGHKGRTMDFEGVTAQNATPEQLAALAEYARNDAELEYKLLEALLPKLETPTVELRVAQQALHCWTKPRLVCDSMLGNLLLKQMTHEQTAAIKRLGLQVTDISKEKNFEHHLEMALTEAGDLLQRYLKPTKRGYAPALAKDDSMREVLLNHSSPCVRDLCEAKVGRRSWPLHIGRVKRIMEGATCAGGKLRVGLQYHAAHTGRDGGTEDRNWQNLPKHGSSLLLALRGLMRAAPGHRLVRVDLNAIEARVVGWLAGQKNMLSDFAAFDQGKDQFDIYQKFASSCLLKPLAEITDEDRAIGKIGVLGCGYGMGPYLPDSNKSQPNVMFLSAGLDLRTAETVVYTYRRQYPLIPILWNTLERAFAFTLTKGIPSNVGPLRLFKTAEVPLCIQLPSGRCLRYHNAAMRHGQIHLGNKAIWGGYLAENCTQAVARDILMEAAVKVEAAGIQVCHRVHDEVICQATLSVVDSVAAEVKKILITPPMWAIELPLNGKATIAVRYSA